MEDLAYVYQRKKDPWIENNIKHLYYMPANECNPVKYLIKEVSRKSRPVIKIQYPTRATYLFPTLIMSMPG